MPALLSYLLAALESVEETAVQRAPEATLSAVWLNAHEERLVRRHLATSSASKAPVEDKLTSSWDLPESIEVASSSDSTVDAAVGGVTSTVECERVGGRSGETLSNDVLLAREATGRQGRVLTTQLAAERAEL
jgi:hypothetical protein